MKYLKVFDKFNKNESTKLATYFMDDMDRDFNFTSPNDLQRVTSCIVTYPDGARIKYKVNENYLSDIKTLTLSNLSDGFQGNVESFYLKLFGNFIQFESFMTYKRIRFYMNREDLYSTNFESYICNEETGSFIEVVTSFDKDNDTPNDIRPITSALTMDQNLYRVLLSIMTLNKMDYLQIFKTKMRELRHEFMHIIENGNKTYKVDFSSIIVDKMPLILYLYLYNSLVEKTDDITKILKNNGNWIDRDDLYIALLGIHN